MEVILPDVTVEDVRAAINAASEERWHECQRCGGIAPEPICDLCARDVLCGMEGGQA